MNTEAEKIAEYRRAVQGCVLASKLLQQFDIPALLQAIERADAFGPLLDPTLWLRNADKMNQDREVLEAALPLYRLGQKIAAMVES